VSSPATSSNRQTGRLAASRARRDLAAASAYALLVPFFALIVCVISLLMGVRGQELLMVALAMLTTVIAFIPVVVQRLIPPERRHLFISFLSLVFVLYFALPVFTQYFWAVQDNFSVTALYNIELEDVIFGQIAAIIALISLLIGFALPLGSLIRTALPLPRHEWGEQNSLLVAVSVILLGWVVFLSGRVGLGFIPTSLGSGAVGSVGSFYVFGIALLTIVYLKFQSRTALSLMLFFIPISMFFGFLTGSKSSVLLPAAMVALAHIVTTRQVRASWFIGAIIAITLLYPVAQFYRSVVQVGNTLSAAQVLSDPNRMILLLSTFADTIDPAEYLTAGIRSATSRLSALGILSVIVRDTGDRIPFQGGWTLAMAAVSFVPRVIWPGKPAMAIGVWVTENFGSGPGINSATGPSQIGEFYFSYGWAGVILGWTLLGIYFRAISELFFRPNAPTPALLTAVIALWTTVPALQGTLLNFTSGFLFIAVYVAVLHLLVRVFLGTTIPEQPSTPGARAGP
jgi:hypothetical protein